MVANRGGFRRWSFAAWMLVGLLGIAACGGAQVDDDQEAVDRELELALEGDAEPELADEPAGEAVPEAAPPPAPPAARPNPAPAPAPVPPPAAAPDPEPELEPEPEVEPEIRMVEIVASPGAEFEVELLQELSTRTNSPGDRFTAAVTRPIIENDRVIIRVRSIVSGEVTAVQKSGGSGQEAIIKLAFHDISFDGLTFPLSASVVAANPETQGRYSTGDKAARIGAGAAAGAILGRIIGGNTRGTVIGAAVGAAAGTAITLTTEDVDAVLAEGSILRLRLDEPLVVTVPDDPIRR